MTRSTVTKATIVALVAASMAAPAPAMADDPYGNNPGADELVNVCRDFADNQVGIKRVRGLCTVFYRADDPVGVCITLRDQGLLQQLGYDGMYDCIFSFES